MPPPAAFEDCWRISALAGFSDAERERLRELAANCSPRGGSTAPADSIRRDECLTVDARSGTGADPRTGWYAANASYCSPGPSSPRSVGRDQRRAPGSRSPRAAWRRRPVVLALDDVRQSGMQEGYNVVVQARPSSSRRAKPTAFRRCRRKSIHGHGRGSSAPPSSGWGRSSGTKSPSWIPYGAESPAEFFAVACEYFFDVPEHLRDECPGLYRMLCEFFGQDPGARMEGCAR